MREIFFPELFLRLIITVIYVTIMIGDLNAKTGNDNTGYDEVMGQHGLCQMNENGKRLAFNKLFISGTLFQHKRIRKATWVLPDQTTEIQLDHIIM